MPKLALLFVDSHNALALIVESDLRMKKQCVVVAELTGKDNPRPETV
jgi:hypothetical protein